MSADLAPHMEAIARMLLGDPNPPLSSKTELRWGNNGSLSINLRKGTFYSHEDQQGGGVLDLICREKGFSKSEAVTWASEQGFMEPGKRRSEPKEKSRRGPSRHIEQTFDYAGEDGSVRFQVVRYGFRDASGAPILDSKGKRKKTFKQRREVAGEWVWNVKGIRLVPYRLPELLEAIASERLIFIAEGEKKVDRLVQAGVPATCNPMGANNWSDDLTAHFAGARVIILPDNDDAGRRHGALVAEKLRGVATSIRILDIPGLKPKGDVFDWLEEDHDAEELYALVEAQALPFPAAPREQTETPRPDGADQPRADETEGRKEVKDDAQKKAKAYRFALVRFADIKLHDGLDYRVKGLLPRIGLVVVWGPPKCGKTFWIFDLLMHVALGWPYRGLKVQQGPVVYCALEGASGLARRAEAFRQKRLADDADPPFYLMTTPLGLIQDAPALISDIKQQLGETRPGVIGIDTLNRSLVGSESKDADMAAYIRAADALGRAFECPVVIVHHSPHDADRPRGHGSLMGALDVQIAVRRDTGGNIIAELELAKDGEVGLTFTSRLVPVEIALDEDNEAVFSCVIEPVEASPTQAKPRSRPPSGAARTGLRALFEAIADTGKPAPPASTLPANVQVVTVEQWRTYAYRSGISDGGDSARRKAFTRAHTTLVGGGWVGAWEDFRWPV